MHALYALPSVVILNSNLRNNFITTNILSVSLYLCLSVPLSIIICLKRLKNITCRDPLLFIFKGQLSHTEDRPKLFAKLQRESLSMLKSFDSFKLYLMRFLSFSIVYHCSKYSQFPTHNPLTLNLCDHETPISNFCIQYCLSVGSPWYRSQQLVPSTEGRAGTSDCPGKSQSARALSRKIRF